jgi:hypothetical protein
MNQKQARKGRKVIYVRRDGLIAVATIVVPLQRHASIQCGPPLNQRLHAPLAALIPVAEPRTRRPRRTSRRLA